MSAFRHILVVAALCVLAPGCISFRYDRTMANSPPAKGVVEGLAAGTTTLEDALRALGAPVYVWELSGDEMAVAWGWREDEASGVTFSVPLDQGGSASFGYDELAQTLYGVVLRFDAALVATDVRTGHLNDLRAELVRRRPALVDDAAP